MSYNRWASEAMYIITIQNWEFIGGDVALVQAGYDPNNFTMDLGMLVAIGIFWRLLAMGALGWQFYRRNRK